MFRTIYRRLVSLFRTWADERKKRKSLRHLAAVREHVEATGGYLSEGPHALPRQVEQTLFLAGGYIDLAPLRSDLKLRLQVIDYFIIMARHKIVPNAQDVASLVWFSREADKRKILIIGTLMAPLMDPSRRARTVEQMMEGKPRRIWNYSAIAATGWYCAARYNEVRVLGIQNRAAREQALARAR